MINIQHYDNKASDYPYHLWLLQFVGFSYLIYRLLSRDYSIYGFIPEDLFIYPRPVTSVYPPSFILEIINFHWIYNFIELPSVNTLESLQTIVIYIATCGLLGIFAKQASMVCFFAYLHLTGFMQATNSEIDGGTLCFIALLVISVTNSKSLYSIFQKNSTIKSNDNRWPIYLLFLFVGSFYTYAGINKIIDTGPHWPFVLHLDYWAVRMQESSVFLSSRYCYPELSQILQYYWFSAFSGVITLIGEIGFISILFFPRGRLFFISSMITMHLLVFLAAGINFLGSSIILILCFDWNCLFRKSTIYFDSECSFCIKSISFIKRFDWFKLIKIEPMQSLAEAQHGFSKTRLKNEMGVLEESGTICYGSKGFEKVFEKIPIMYPIAILYKVPFIVYLADSIYKTIAKNRKSLGCTLK